MTLTNILQGLAAGQFPQGKNIMLGNVSIEVVSADRLRLRLPNGQVETWNRVTPLGQSRSSAAPGE